MLLNTVTATELKNMDIPAPRHIVPNLITEGLNILAGAPKMGKSFMSLGIALAVSNGAQAMNKFQVEKPMTVLYLALEDTNFRLKSRLKALHQPANDRLHFATSSRRLSDGGLEGIAEFIDHHPDTGMVIIDTLAKIADPKVSANVYEEEAAMGGAMHSLAHATNTAFVVVHHTRKAAAGDFMHAVSGSSGFTGTADTVMVMSRQRNDPDGAAQLELTGRDIHEAKHDLRWYSPQGGWIINEYRAQTSRAGTPYRDAD